MSTEDYFEDVRVRHARAVAAGLHDAQCEWRANGHYLCHCSKRRSESEGYTTPPGELIHQYPICPRCNNEVGHDGDSFYCQPCKVVWSSAVGTAEFTDDYGDFDMADWDRRKAEASTHG